MQTLETLAKASGVEVEDHLPMDMEIPMISGLQAQGDLLIRPAMNVELEGTSSIVGGKVTKVILDGVHQHVLTGDEGAIEFFRGGRSRLSLGYARVTGEAFLIHPEHGATGLAPGTYEFRRQREMREEERMVLD